MEYETVQDKCQCVSIYFNIKSVGLGFSNVSRGERQEMEPQHLDTFAASCALAAVLKDAGNIEAHMEGFGDLRVSCSFRSD